MCVYSQKKKGRIILKSIKNNRIFKYWKNKTFKIDPEISIIIKEPNSPVKRKKKGPFTCGLQKVHLKDKDIQKLKEKYVRSPIRQIIKTGKGKPV